MSISAGQQKSGEGDCCSKDNASGLVIIYTSNPDALEVNQD